MKLIPCIICNELVKSDNKKVIAKICNNCNTGNLSDTLKKIDYNKVKAIIDKQQLKLTKEGELI